MTRKVFLSYYHKEDQIYVNYINRYLCDHISCDFLYDGEIWMNDSDQYVKQLRNKERITDTTVLVVLIGQNTKGRKHVDWEVYAGLKGNTHGAAGLLGILLPEVPLIKNQYCDVSYIPPRLNDNVNSGYAKIYTWDYAKKHFEEMVEIAYLDRIRLRDKKTNRRTRMKENKFEEDVIYEAGN